MSENVIKSVLGVDVFISIEKEDGILFAKGECPVSDCTNTEDSTDNGYGADYAVTITAGKIRTHLIKTHGWEDDSEDSTEE